MRLALALACAGVWACATTAGNLPQGAIEVRGEWRQGNLIFGRVAPGTTVEFNGRPLRVAADGAFVVGLDRDEPPQAVLDFMLPSGARERREYVVAPRTYDIQRIDGLPPSQVTPPPEAQQRIAQDVREVRQARLRDSALSHFLETFIWPCTGPISGVYGSQRILNGVPKQPHYGVDVAVPVGTEVVAPAGGIVTLAARDMYYTGGTLMIDHGHGLSSAFLHLSRLHVKVGDVVQQGQRIAEVGATGRVTGPHLDWRISWFDARVDPQRLVPPMPPGKQGRAPSE